MNLFKTREKNLILSFYSVCWGIHAARLYVIFYFNLLVLGNCTSANYEFALHTNFHISSIYEKFIDKILINIVEITATEHSKQSEVTLTLKT